MTFVTRFAPSPTGHLHIGGARTALFCWAFARRNGGSFILRIEDTDTARSSDGSARGIMEDLAWLDIAWNEGPTLGDIGGDPRGVGPFFQARRLEHYNAAVMRLVQEGKAYPAFESSEELDAKRKVVVAAKQTYRYDRAAVRDIPEINDRLARMAAEPHVVRFMAPREEVVVKDQVLGDVKYAAGEMDDFVIRKADGLPTYHFAVVVDDELMGVTHVLRAQEHLQNTPRHVALQKALGFRTPVYAHMPLIFNMDGTKMGKRDKAKAARKALLGTSAVPAESSIPGVAPADLAAFVAAENDSMEIAEKVGRHLNIVLPEVQVADFRANGYIPEAICNFLSLLGWNPGMKQADGKDLEKFDTAFLAANFAIDRIGKTNAKFDRAKLLSFNGDYLAALPDEAFTRRWGAWMAEFEPAAWTKLGREPATFAMLARTVKQRAKTLRDALKAAGFAMRDDAATDFDAAAVEKHLRGSDGKGASLLREFRARLAALETFDPASITATMDALVREHALPNPGPIAQAVRVAVAGVPVTPGIGETLAVIGKAGALSRIDACLARV